MTIKKFIFPLLYSALIFLSSNFSTKAQEIPDDGNKPMIDTIETEENLLDSNEVYKQQFDSLSKDGDWLKVDKSDFIRELSEETGEDLEYFSNGEIIYVWRPYHSNRYWNPYLDGRWVFSRHGWIWLSDYEWGWGPYNYGRWYCSNVYGWIWLPGSVWAPNWVSWRYHNSYVGWYPTCPRFYWRDYGNRYCTNRLYAYAPANWLFVRKNDFTKKVSTSTIANTSDNTEILKNSVKIKTAVYADSELPKFKYSGPDVKDIAKEIGEKITPRDVRAHDVKGKQSADDETVSTYKKTGSYSSDENNPRRFKGYETGSKEIDRGSSKNSTTDDKIPPGNSETKKVRTRQYKGSTEKDGTSNKGNEGSNKGNTTKSNDGKRDSNSTRSNEGSKQSNTDKKVERSGSNNDSGNEKSTRESK